jgi:hypothetical protein
MHQHAPAKPHRKWPLFKSQGVGEPNHWNLLPFLAKVIDYWGPHAEREARDFEKELLKRLCPVEGEGTAQVCIRVFAVVAVGLAFDAIIDCMLAHPLSLAAMLTPPLSAPTTQIKTIRWW